MATLEISKAHPIICIDGTGAAAQIFGHQLLRGYLLASAYGVWRPMLSVAKGKKIAQELPQAIYILTLIAGRQTPISLVAQPLFSIGR